MKKRILKTVFFAVIIGIVAMLIIGFDRSRLDQYESEVDTESYRDAYQYLVDDLGENPYVDYVDYADIDYTLNDGDVSLSQGNISDQHSDGDRQAVLVKEGQQAIYDVVVEHEGYYKIAMDYFLNGDTLNNYLVNVKINGEIPFEEAEMLTLPIIWQDETKNYEIDRYGDELSPSQQVRIGWHSVTLNDNRYVSEDGLYFYLESGINTIEVSNPSPEVLILGQLSVKAPQPTPDYNQYLAMHSDDAKPEQEIVLQATDYMMKDSAFIRVDNRQTPSVAPFDARHKKINVVEAWEEPGQTLFYEVDVPVSGLYELSLYYATDSADFNVFRTVRIDGQVPFEEAKSIMIEATDKSWEMTTLSDKDDTFSFFLDEGRHVISLTADTARLSERINDMQVIINHINAFALDIRKVTGNVIVEDRTWEFTKVFPETVDYLQAYETILKYNILQLSQYSEKQDLSSKLSFLNLAVEAIDDISEKPDELPLYVDQLYSGSSSVNQYLGDTIGFMEEQNMSLNQIHLANGRVTPKNVSIFKRIGVVFEEFVVSLSADKYYEYDENSEALQIWVGRSTTHVDAMQKISDSLFTPQTGIRVDFSVMPNVDKLVLASAGDVTPDAAFGLPSYVPYNLAIRGALYDLTQFDDFWTYAGDKFVPGAMVPYTFNEGVYAMPETLNFNAIIYREDIFSSLDLSVPDTWQDVLGLLPQLQRYDMNFYYPTAGGPSTKWFYQTVPLIYQYGGQIYTENGLNVSLDDRASVEALQFLGDLFTTYSVPEQVPSFYNEFRYNSLPIGIINFNDYVTISNSAPEIEGKWELAPTPAYVDSDTGDMNRWYVGNGMGGIIFNDSKHIDDVWTFFKWWLSTDTQIEFARNMQSTYGPTFLWLSANYNAIEELAIPADDKAVIMSQIHWIRDVPRTPGQYLVERGISDIWNKMVFENQSARVAIDDVVTDMNREIERKMIEFGYLENGIMIKPYRIADLEWIRQQLEAGEGEDDEA